MPRKTSTRTKLPLTPERVHPVPGRAQAGKLLPGATIYGVLPDSTEYVAWDGKQYVLCQTKERVLADATLLLIGSVQELRVDHPHAGPVDRVEVVIPTSQLKNGSTYHSPEPVTRQRTIETSANNVLENSKDAILSYAAGAVSEILRREVTGCLKRLVTINYESQKEIEQALEWQELIGLFRNACGTYADIAMGNRRKIKTDPLGWVKAQIQVDSNLISRQHFRCDRNGYCFVEESPSKVSFEDDQDVWSAGDHVGMNTIAFRSVYFDVLDRATSGALGSAAIRIASGRTSPLQPAKQVTSPTTDRSQAESRPNKSTPLSTFESMIGRLMVQARMRCPTKYLSKDEIVRIADLLDSEKVPVRINLEREAGRSMAEYNQRHSKAAIKSWRAALGHPQFRRAVRKRFSRAEDKCRRSNPQLS